MNMLDGTVSRRKLLAAGIGLLGAGEIARAADDLPTHSSGRIVVTKGFTAKCHNELMALPPDKMLERVMCMLVKAENAARNKDELEEQFPPFKDDSLKFFVPADQVEMKKIIEKTLVDGGLDEESLQGVLADFAEGKKAPTLMIYNVGNNPETAKSYFVVNKSSITDPLKLLLPLTNYLHHSRMSKAGVEASPGFQQLASVAAARTIALLANYIAQEYGAEDSIASSLRAMNVEQQQDNWTGVAHLYKHVQTLMGLNEGLREKLNELRQSLKPEPDPKFQQPKEDKPAQQEAPAPQAPRFVPAAGTKVAIYKYDAKLNPSMKLNA